MRSIFIALSTVLCLLIAGCSTNQKFTSTAPEAWSNIQPGMTKQDVHDALGDPQTFVTAEAKEIWEGHDRWKLVVTYDAADKVVKALNSFQY